MRAGRRMASTGGSGGGGGGGFDPSTIANLKLWLKADTIGVGDGNTVTTWSDSSGLGNDVTQATSTRRPIFRASTAAFGNKATVQFDGSDDYLKNASPVTTVVDNWTVIVAAQETNTTTTVIICDVGDSNNGWGVSTNTNTGKKGFLRGGIAWGNTTTAGDTTAQILTAERASGTTTIYVGTTALSPTFSGAPATPVNGTFIGAADGTGANSYLTGHIAEVLVYAAALSSTDRGNVIGYLQTKYGL